jgi:hypothetical protein
MLLILVDERKMTPFVNRQRKKLLKGKLLVELYFNIMNKDG